MIDLTCSFLVVTSGKPSLRSNRIWWPKIDSVPVPVRSCFSAPSASTRSINSRYWRIAGSRRVGQTTLLSNEQPTKTVQERRAGPVDRLNEANCTQHRGGGKNPDRIDPREIADNSCRA